MIYSVLNTGLFIRILLLCGTGIAIGYTISIEQYRWTITLNLALIVLIINILHYFNRINEKLSYFFDAVRNEDSTLHFNEKAGDKASQKLHASLNHLNKTLSDIKIRNEYNERFFRELLHYSATGIVVADSRDYVELINEAALKLLGIPAMAHLGILKQKKKDLYELMKELQPGQTRTMKYLKGQEMLPLSVQVAQLQFGDINYLVYSLHDIKAEMEENEVESWQKLIRVLTHEIMNSVAPITSLSKTMQRFLNFEDASQAGDYIEKAREGLGVIEETGKGLMHFIDNYRRLTKLPKPVFKPVAIEEWIKRIFLLLKERFEEEHISVQVLFNSKQKELLVDEKLLSQVLINILKNAIEAMQSSDRKEIILRTEDVKGKLQLSIANTGIPIEKEILDKIFVPFFTTKEQGSGIGLSLSRQIMRMHKGSIGVQSSDDGKTVFVLKF